MHLLPVVEWIEFLHYTYKYENGNKRRSTYQRQERTPSIAELRLIRGTPLRLAGYPQSKADNVRGPIRSLVGKAPYRDGHQQGTGLSLYQPQFLIVYTRVASACYPSLRRNYTVSVVVNMVKNLEKHHLSVSSKIDSKSFP